MRHKGKGMTLIEILVALVMFSVVVAVVLSLLYKGQRTKSAMEARNEAQENARLAGEFVADYLRMLGYGVDDAAGQQAVVYAGPYEIIFNANVDPFPDDPENPGYPLAINPSKSPACPHYSPSTQFSTGAETYRITLDYNGDGMLSEADRSAANVTPNPNDYFLIFERYGETADGNNGGETQVVSIVRGPDQYPNPNDTVMPLFAYWYEVVDEATGTVTRHLWGDTNDDGVLSADEYTDLDPMPDSLLSKIVVVDLTLVGETGRTTGQNRYERVVYRASIDVTRNKPPERYWIVGHVYNDTDGDGIFSGESGVDGTVDSIAVKLSTTGQAMYVDANGVWRFYVSPGTHTIVLMNLPPGWKRTSDGTIEVEIVEGDTSFLEDDRFGVRWVGTGTIQGYVLKDEGIRGEYEPTVDTLGIADYPIQVGIWKSVTDGNGFFSQEVTAGDTFVVATEQVEGYRGTFVDTAAGSSPASFFVSIDTTDFRWATFVVDTNDVDTVYFGKKEAVGEPCTVHVVVPNGGQEWITAQQETICWYADGIDDNVTRANIYYSLDAGTTWTLIDTVSNSSVTWNGKYVWTLPNEASNTASVKVAVYDEGDNYAEDTSDSLFSIAFPAWLADYYFTTDTTGTGDYYIRLCKTSPGNGRVSAGIKWTSSARLGKFEVEDNPGNSSTKITWITPKGKPGVDTIKAGTWEFVIYGDRDPVGGTQRHRTYIAVEVFAVDSVLKDTTYLFFTEWSDTLYHSPNVLCDTITKDTTAIPLEYGKGTRLMLKVWINVTDNLGNAFDNEFNARFEYNAPRGDVGCSYFHLPR